MLRVDHVKTLRTLASNCAHGATIETQEVTGVARTKSNVDGNQRVVAPGKDGGWGAPRLGTALLLQAASGVQKFGSWRRPGKEQQHLQHRPRRFELCFACAVGCLGTSLRCAVCRGRASLCV